MPPSPSPKQAPAGPHPLLSRFAALRRRWRLVTLLRGLSAFLLVLLGCLLAFGLADYRWHLPPLVRALLLLATLGTGAAVAAVWLAALRRRLDDLSLALRIEAEYAVFNDALASTVQFLQTTPADSRESAMLRDVAVQRTLRLAEGCDFHGVIPDRDLYYLVGGAGLACALAAYLAMSFPMAAGSALLRLGHPFGQHQWPTETVLVSLEYPKRIATGQLFQVRGELGRKIPEHAVVEFEGLTSVRERREYDVARADGGATGTFVAKVSLASQYRGFRFRVRANDITSPAAEGRWHSVEVGPPPRLTTPQVTLHHPAYTDLPSPESLPAGTGQVEAVSGTRVRFESGTDRPITRAWVTQRPGVREAEGMRFAALGTVGQTSPLGTLGIHAGLAAATDRVDATVAPSRRRLAVDFWPAVSGTYLVHIEDGDNLAKDYEFDMTVEADPPPYVNILQPATNQKLLEDAVVSLGITAQDERFAVRSVALEYRRKDASGRYTEAGFAEVPLYDHTALARELSAQAAGLHGLGVGLPPEAFHLRPRRVAVRRDWSLAGLAGEGETLVIRARAEDFNDVLAVNTPGRSHEVEIQIVKKSALQAVLDGREQQIQQTLLRLREWQEKALEKVLEAEQQAKAGGELRPVDLDQLLEAEQLQKQIEARVGAKAEEGLRAELAQLLQMLKNNQIDSAGVKDRLELVKGELDRVAQEHLPQIPPKITGARQQTGDSDKDRAGREKDLADARSHQEGVRKALDGLLEHLEQWSGLQELRGEARSLENQQRELQGATKELEAKFQPGDREWEAAKGRVAALQSRLNERAQKLLDKMDRVAQEKDTLGQTPQDKAQAEMLKAAAETGRSQMLPQQMKDTAKQLEQNQVNRAIRQQDLSLDILGQMIDGLTEKRDNELERLVKKQAGAKKDIDDLLERLEKHRDKVEQAKKLADEGQRRQALRQLADEQKKLEDEARAKSRELARLRAQEASRQLEEAADQMAQAGERLGQGEDPAEPQQGAQEKTEQARRELDRAEEQTREELARERLARIADQIQDLKLRQDAAITETERIQTSVLRQGWTGASLISLLNHGQAQLNLANEAKKLASKLDGAMAFELLLNKSAENMEAAGRAIDARRKQAIDAGRRGVFPLEPEELADENRAQQLTLRYQTQARDRLQRLLDAVETAKQEQGKQAKPPERGGPGENGGDGQKGNEQPKGGDNAGAALPPVAQLQILRAEQSDIYERTRSFNEAHPEGRQLTDADRQELTEIQADQEAVFQVFQQLATAANKGGAE